jgi:hypothetical protein
MNTRALGAGLLAALLFVGVAPAFAATQTPGGTNITNQASASYTDNNGNALSAVSNTVTTVVQNAPSLTDTNGGNQTVAPNQAVSQIFTLTNTGNSPGSFNLSAATISGGSATITNYQATVPGQSIQTFATFTALQTYLAAVAQSVIAGNAAIVQINYNVGASAAASTITGTVTSTIVDPAVGAAPSATSAPATSAEVDTVANDGRLDVSKSSAQNAGTGVITYTLGINNGGQFTAHYVQALSNASFGFGALTTTGTIGGILVADKIPTFAGGNPAITGSPSVAFTRGSNGFPADASETARVICSTSTDGASAWSTTCNGASVWIGVLVSGGSLANTQTGGDGLLANAAGSTATGGLNGGPKTTAAAITLTFSITPPTGTGSANANSIVNVANGVFTNNGSTPQIIGSGTSTTDGVGATAAVVTDIANTTGNTGAGPSGASQAVPNSALSAFAVFTGPFGQATALGDVTNSGTATVNNDFTEVAFKDAAAPPTTTSTDPAAIVGNSTSNPITFWVRNDVQNTGNKDDNISLAVVTPNVTGWSSQLVTANLSTTALNGATAAGPGATSSTSTPIALASGATTTYWVKYTAPAGTASFTAFDAKLTATGSLNGATPNTNDTHNELYNGFIALTKEATIESDGCPTTTTGTFGANGGNVGGGTTKVCPGGVIRYDIFFKNVAKGNTGTGATLPGTAVLSSAAGTFTMLDDGTAAGSWFATIPTTSTFVTSGVNAVPTLLVNAIANTNSVCTYSYGSPAAGPTTTFTAPTFGATPSNGPSKMSCVVGGAAFTVNPGDTGTLTFRVTARLQ